MKKKNFELFNKLYNDMINKGMTAKKAYKKTVKILRLA